MYRRLFAPPDSEDDRSTDASLGPKSASLAGALVAIGLAFVLMGMHAFNSLSEDLGSFIPARCC